MPKLPARPPPPRRERDVTAEGRAELSRAGVLNWRNNVGVAKMVTEHGATQHVAYGLCPGSADVIACVETLLDCPSCGARLPPIGRFVGVEFKGPNARWSDEQRAWGALVEKHHGVYGLVYERGDVVSVLQRARGVW